MTCWEAFLWELDNDASGVEASVGAAESSDDAVAAALGGAQIYEEDLVLVVMDDAAELDAEVDEIRGGELTLEDGVLEVVAVAAHDFEDLAEAFVVGDVVGDEVGGAHGGWFRLVGRLWRMELFKQKG
jgi:hypothetical protein